METRVRFMLQPFRENSPVFSGRVEWRNASFATGDERQIASAADIIHENSDLLYGISPSKASPTPLPVNITSHGKEPFLPMIVLHIGYFFHDNRGFPVV
jgi:hypothetical protein